MSQTHEDPTQDFSEPVTQHPSTAHDDVVSTGDASEQAPTGASVTLAPGQDDEHAAGVATADEDTFTGDGEPGLSAEASAESQLDGEAFAESDQPAPDVDAATDTGGDSGTSAEGETDSDSDDAVAIAGSSHRSRRSPSRDLLEKEGEIAADFLETLLDICDLDGDLDVDIDGDRAAVSIVDSDEGRVPRRLVGSDGKVLDALQELTRLAVYSSTGERSRLILDIAGHRAGRRSVLVEQAQTAIAAVKESGEQQALEPMSAFERKIVHDEVLAAGLRSESDGVEPRRFVVVLPA